MKWCYSSRPAQVWHVSESDTFWNDYPSPGGKLSTYNKSLEIFHEEIFQDVYTWEHLWNTVEDLTSGQVDDSIFGCSLVDYVVNRTSECSFCKCNFGLRTSPLRWNIGFYIRTFFEFIGVPPLSSVRRLIYFPPPTPVSLRFCIITSHLLFLCLLLFVYLKMFTLVLLCYFGFCLHLDSFSYIFFGFGVPISSNQFSTFITVLLLVLGILLQLLVCGHYCSVPPRAYDKRSSLVPCKTQTNNSEEITWSLFWGFKDFRVLCRKWFWCIRSSNLFLAT